MGSFYLALAQAPTTPEQGRTMKFNPTFQTLRTIKATMAISVAVYGAVVLVARHGAAHHGWCAIAIAVALSLGALHVREYPEPKKPATREV
jgi:hypothetical protein